MAHAFRYLKATFRRAWAVGPALVAGPSCGARNNCNGTPASGGPTRTRFRRSIGVARASLLGGLLASALTAQSAGPPPVRFSVFAAKPIADLTFVPRANAEPQKIQFFPTARSTRAEYRGPMPLRFTDATSGAVVAEATIPAGMRDTLLLFSPIAETAKTGGLRYQIAVVDDSTARQAPGTLAIINLSGLTLTGTLGEAALTVAAGLNAPVNLARPSKVLLKTTMKGKTYQSYAGEVKIGRNERALLILFPPFYAGSLEVQSRLLLDLPPGMAPAKKAAK